MATILVVDDDFTTLKTMKNILQSWGHDVIAAKDGSDALAFLQVNPNVDLLITDVIMPRVDGSQLLRAVKKDHRLEDVQALMMSSTVSMTDEDVLKLGGQGFLLKPVGTSDLVARVAYCLHIPPPSTGPLSSRRWVRNSEPAPLDPAFFPARETRANSPTSND